MSHGFSESERNRMRKFANTPKYKRSPAQLEPEEESE